MKIKTLVSILLALNAWASADPTWPSSNDELEEIMYQVEGFQNRGFGGTVIPCSSQSSGPGRQNAAEWLRTGFHDMSTRNVFSGKGGLDGSLQYEVGRGENTGPGFQTTLKFMSNYYTNRSSVADLIALGVYYSVRSCGGPAVPVRGGRIDATAAGDTGVPQPQNTIYSLQQRFIGMGFDNTEMIQMVACVSLMIRWAYNPTDKGIRATRLEVFIYRSFLRLFQLVLQMARLVWILLWLYSTIKLLQNTWTTPQQTPW